MCYKVIRFFLFEIGEEISEERGVAMTSDKKISNIVKEHL